MSLKEFFFKTPFLYSFFSVRFLMKMAKKNKGNHDIKRIDALRLKKYLGCCIAQSRNCSFEEFKKNITAPIEHLFDSHEFCSSDWCYAKCIDDKMLHYIKRKRNEMVRGCFLNKNYVEGLIFV